LSLDRVFERLRLINSLMLYELCEDLCSNFISEYNPNKRHPVNSMMYWNVLFLYYRKLIRFKKGTQTNIYLSFIYSSSQSASPGQRKHYDPYIRVSRNWNTKGLLQYIIEHWPHISCFERFTNVFWSDIYSYLKIDLNNVLRY